MDFFGAQAHARKQSKLLGFGFAFMLMTVVLALDVVLLTALRIGLATDESDPQPYEDSLLIWASHHLTAVVLITLLVGLFIGGASLYRSLQLRAGGGYVARSLGGTRVMRSTPDVQRRRLHNVVEEMALASGVAMPEVYVLEDEESINAFAAGHSPTDAAVAVTRGTLEKLNREQLQAVIAHEFSHILNGDMRLSIRLMGFVFGLMAVAIVGRMLIRVASHGNRKKGGAALMAIGAGLAVIGLLGFWGGRILQAWISRKRESLADASAVQFTRNPEGLKNALIRIAAQGSGQHLANANMEQVGHMLFTSGFARVLSTHPPVLERIQALSGGRFDQSRLSMAISEVHTQWRREQALAAEGATDEEAAAPATAAAASATALPANVSGFAGGAAPPANIAATIGAPAAQHLALAARLRNALPQEELARAEAPQDALALLLALVLGNDAAEQRAQLQLVTNALGTEVASKMKAAAVRIQRVPQGLRLQVVFQLFPALHGLKEDARVQLIELLKALSRADGKISVFEYALEKVATSGLITQLKPRQPHGRRTLADVEASLGVVFAVLARRGAQDEMQAQRAYEVGLSHLLPMHRPPYAVITDWVPAFDTALDDLAKLQVIAKQLLIEGLVRTVAHDNRVTPAEAELLRAICAVLECPMPPALPRAT